jgi:4-diphosphocytidyl-2-C-methyl-D-erythritol kinase
MVRLLAEFAPAKINLFLRVVGRRPDGYHELDSIFVPISLCDHVAIEVRPSQAVSISLAMRSGVGDIPSNDRNLAWRAAAAMMKEFGLAAQVLIDLHKEIPAGAGLGGGSSDAGAVLRMMAALYQIGDRERLAKAAAGLGADVPFFLDPRPARVGGIGERIAPLDSMPMLHLVVAAPPDEVSTAEVFAALTPDDWSGAAPDADVRAIASGRFEASALVNDLEPVAIRLCPEIRRLKAILQELGASAAAMTGSGGAVFGIFPSAESAVRAAEAGRIRAPESRFIAASSPGL